MTDRSWRLVAEVQLPVGELVEAIGGRKIVHADMTAVAEALVLLMTEYPEPLTVTELTKSMDRRNPGSVRATVSTLWKKKLVHRGADKKIVLTETGLRAAVIAAQSHLA
jgi:Mn-dependent DtxR family transcriptional regulator